MKTIYEKLAGCSSDGEIKRMLEGNGMVIVPAAPTKAMLSAGYTPFTYMIEPHMSAAYKLMVEASQVTTSLSDREKSDDAAEACWCTGFAEKNGLGEIIFCRECGKGEEPTSVQRETHGECLSTLDDCHARGLYPDYITCPTCPHNSINATSEKRESEKSDG